MLDVLWIVGAMERADECVVPDAQFYIDHSESPLSAAEHVDTIQQYHIQTRFTRIEVLEFAALDDERCYIRIKCDLHIKVIDAYCHMYVTILLKARDDRVAECRYIVDRYAMLGELGALPEDAYYLALAGEKFT
ncbi:hypothetical protein [Primorskyibacter sp. S187A]|uniref:hypothetical protein n=1 Tax=Primorskyibacter sp. S187A TaxID=3415130 RepID=UPI003C7B276B